MQIESLDLCQARPGARLGADMVVISGDGAIIRNDGGLPTSSSSSTPSRDTRSACAGNINLQF